MTMPSLASRFAGRPLALAPRALRAICSTARASPARGALEPLLAATPIEALSDLAPVLRGAGFSMTDGGIAVVPVVGPMVSRGDWLTDLFGIGDYGAVGSTIADAFADPATHAVMMEIDSPGGEVGGLFVLVETIRSLKLETGKPLWAVASESALSAAYAIAAQGARLGVTVDAAEAMKKGIRPDALRRSILDALATRAQASAIVSAAPQTPVAPGSWSGAGSDSPIVRRARERATANRS